MNIETMAHIASIGASIATAIVMAFQAYDIYSKRKEDQAQSDDGDD